jgi:hypothetical protein
MTVGTVAAGKLKSAPAAAALGDGTAELDADSFLEGAPDKLTVIVPCVSIFLGSAGAFIVPPIGGSGFLIAVAAAAAAAADGSTIDRSSSSSAKRLEKCAPPPAIELDRTEEARSSISSKSDRVETPVLRPDAEELGDESRPERMFEPTPADLTRGATTAAAGAGATAIEAAATGAAATGTTAAATGAPAGIG